MVLLLFTLCFVMNLLFVQCEFNITVLVNKKNEKCIVEPTYYVPRNQSISIYYKNELYCEPKDKNEDKICDLNHIRYSDNEEFKLTNNFGVEHVDFESSDEGVIIADLQPKYNTTKYRFLFLYLKSTGDYRFSDENYSGSNCSTEIRLVDPDDPVLMSTLNFLSTEGITLKQSSLIGTTPIPKDNGTTVLPDDKTNSTASSTSPWVYAGSGLAVVAVLTMAAQTAGIMYFKAKAAKLDRDKNLSGRRPDGETELARYSTMPGQKAIKVPPLGKRREKEREQERESKIYETVNIQMTDMPPPEPPAISSLPRLPRNRKNETKTHLAPPTPAMGLRGVSQPASPMMRTRDRELPRPIPATPVSQRPPIPLPTEDDHYEDVTFESDDTYEPPPILETQHLLPARTPVKTVRNPLPVPPKPLDHRAVPDIAKTPIKPKPKPKISPPIHEPVASELDNIFKKRRNVLQAPIQSIPEPNTSKNNAPITKPKPPPVVKKPVMLPPPMEASEPLYDEHCDSSDEEWTYEPLKPIDPHIYNI